MKGIILSCGTVFVTDGLHTLRKTKSTDWQLSPILYQNVEWDLRTEQPDTWDYLTNSDIKGLPDGGYEKILTLLEKLETKLGRKRK